MLKRIYLVDEVYFITSKTYNNKPIFNNKNNCELFFKVLKDCKEKYNFKLYGFVLIPNHVHLLIMPDDKINISDTIHRIKGNFAYQYIITQKQARNHKGSATWLEEKITHTNDNPARAAEPLWLGNHVWQKSFHDHIVRNDLDFDEKLNYIHGNPYKHNITNNLDNYPWSSYQNYYLNNNKLIKIDYLDA